MNTIKCSQDMASVYESRGANESRIFPANVNIMLSGGELTLAQTGELESLFEIERRALHCY